MKFNYIKLLVFAVLFVFAFLSCNCAEAKTYKMIAYSLDRISTTQKMPKYLTLKVPAQMLSGGDVQLQNESLIRVKILEVSPAKRGKRDGYVVTKLIAYSIPALENQAVDVSDKNIELKIKRYQEKDFKGLAQTAATTVVSHVAGIPFLNQGVAVVKGAVKPKEGTSRVKSAGVSLYESTPFAYFNKGKNLEVGIGEKLTLTVRTVDEDGAGAPNYEYTPQ